MNHSFGLSRFFVLSSPNLTIVCGKFATVYKAALFYGNVTFGVEPSINLWTEAYLGEAALITAILYILR